MPQIRKSGDPGKSMDWLSSHILSAVKLKQIYYFSLSKQQNNRVYINSVIHQPFESNFLVRIEIDRVRIQHYKVTVLTFFFSKSDVPILLHIMLKYRFERALSEDGTQTRNLRGILKRKKVLKRM